MMKLDATKWTQLFPAETQTAMLDTREDALHAIRFSVPQAWNTLPQSDDLLYFLLPEESGIVSIQRVIPESTDYTSMDTEQVLNAFANGMWDEMTKYEPKHQAEYYGTLGNHTIAYGFRYAITVEDTTTQNCTVLFMVEHSIYCISFSNDALAYGISFLEQLHFAESIT